MGSIASINERRTEETRTDFLQRTELWLRDGDTAIAHIVPDGITPDDPFLESLTFQSESIFIDNGKKIFCRLRLS